MLQSNACLDSCTQFLPVPLAYCGEQEIGYLRTKYIERLLHTGDVHDLVALLLKKITRTLGLPRVGVHHQNTNGRRKISRVATTLGLHFLRFLIFESQRVQKVVRDRGDADHARALRRVRLRRLASACNRYVKELTAGVSAACGRN